MKQLMEQAKKGDGKALRELLMSHQHLIESVVRRYALDKAEHDDVLQNICKRVIVSISSYQETAQFSTWLYRLAMNECMDANRSYFRRRGRCDDREIQIDLFPDLNAGDGLTIAISQEIQILIQEIISALPDGMRRAIELFYREELTGAEAAAKIGITSQAFFVRLGAAREKIRHELANKGVYHER